jgi:hypothetical protein
MRGHAAAVVVVGAAGTRRKIAPVAAAAMRMRTTIGHAAATATRIMTTIVHAAAAVERMTTKGMDVHLGPAAVTRKIAVRAGISATRKGTLKSAVVAAGCDTNVLCAPTATKKATPRMSVRAATSGTPRGIPK